MRYIGDCNSSGRSWGDLVGRHLGAIPHPMQLPLRYPGENFHGSLWSYLFFTTRTKSQVRESACLVSDFCDTMTYIAESLNCCVFLKTL